MIPDGAKGLRKVALDTKVLMVDIVAVQHNKIMTVSLRDTEEQRKDSYIS